MLWLALFLPQLPLDLAYRRWPQALRDGIQRSIPLAITEGKRIRWLNARARDAGIVVGMSESGAHARAADLALFPRDAEGEAEAVRETAMWALHFTPQVSLRPGGLLMDVSASLRLFGGRDALVRALRDGVLEFGLTPQLGSAPTASAAWLFALHAGALHGDALYGDALHGDGESFIALLDALPVALLLSAQPHLHTLQAIGCQTIGQLRRLPRAGITRRFGKEMLAEIDRAVGLEPQVHAWFEPPPTFCARMELPARVDTTEALLFAARRLLMQMTGWLAARHAAVSAFVLLLHHEAAHHARNAVTTVMVALGNPSRDLPHLTLLLQEHLARVTLSASVIELTLRADDIAQLAAPNSELFPTPASQAESMGQLIEKLASRLGDAAISRLSIVADHRPEKCSIAVPVRNMAAMPRQQAELAHAFPARPAWLLHQPIPLLTRQHKPFYQSPLTLLAGPERIEAGWWDEALATRDYYIACNDSYLLLWIYRERQASHDSEPGWFLHGFFG